MIEIVSFPFDGRVARTHRDILKHTGKPYWVGLSGNDYLEALGEPVVPPKLMFVDFMCLENIDVLAAREEDFRHLLKVPAIVIASFDSLLFSRVGLNIVGTMAVSDQYELKAWDQIIGAFDQAQQATPDRPVTRQAFDSALKAHVA